MHVSDNTNQVIGTQSQAAPPCLHNVCPVTECDVSAGNQASSTFFLEEDSQATSIHFPDAVQPHLTVSGCHTGQEDQLPNMPGSH